MIPNSREQELLLLIYLSYFRLIRKSNLTYYKRHIVINSPYQIFKKKYEWLGKPVKQCSRRYSTLHRSSSTPKKQQYKKKKNTHKKKQLTTPLNKRMKATANGGIVDICWVKNNTHTKTTTKKQFAWLSNRLEISNKICN